MVTLACEEYFEFECEHARLCTMNYEFGICDILQVQVDAFVHQQEFIYG